jgi:hypothetical protein
MQVLLVEKTHNETKIICGINSKYPLHDARIELMEYRFVRA